MKKFDSGAVRSNDADGYRLDLLPVEGVIRAGAASAHGAEKYGEHNWQKGMPLSEFINHLLVHIYKYLSGDRSEDHLGHAAWNALAACTAEERGWTKESLAKGSNNGHAAKSEKATAADEFHKALMEEYEKSKNKLRSVEKSPPTPPVLGHDTPEYSIVEQKKVGALWETIICIGLSSKYAAYISIRSTNQPGPADLDPIVRQYMQRQGWGEGDDREG